MKTRVAMVALAVWLCGAVASAGQFSYLDPGYGQEIYTGPLTLGQEAGMAWTSNNNLLTRAGSTILEHSLVQNTTYQGTLLHDVTVAHPITGLSSTGYGMTNGKDGYIYVATGTGLERFKPSNWAAPAQALAGTVGGWGWGITTLMDGRIAYSDGGSPSNIYVYNPSAGTNTLIYTAAGGVQVDDIEASTTGQIALAGHSNSTMTIISTSGAWINTFSTPHYPDGLAFGDGAASGSLFSNNNNGSITRYDFAPGGYTTLLSWTDIATNLYTGGSTGGAYGDLASVGPDCAFYVTQYENGGSNGSTPGVGTHWDNGVTTADASIVRIFAVDSNGMEVCGFASTTENVPEPGTVFLLLAGLGALPLCSRRARSALLGGLRLRGPLALRGTPATRRASSVSACSRTALVVVALSVVSVGSERASAAVLYATSIPGNQIDRVDTVANTVSLYLGTSSGADSVMFDSAQRTIYTLHYAGEVRRYDPNTAIDTGIASGLNFPADIALEPGGNTMLVSEIWAGNIKRINLTSFAVTTLLTSGGNPEGLAYVGTRLFANLGYRGGGPTGKYVAELDPVTGSILNQSPGLDSLDGLTYDSFSGRLFASSLYGNSVLSINPNNLNDVQDVTSKLGTIPGPDGITSDGLGNIFIAAGGDEHVYQLDLINNTLTQKNYVYGLDDLAPASGLGSMPEPSTFAILGVGAVGFLGWGWHRHRRS